MNSACSESLSHFEMAFIITKQGTASHVLEIAHRSGALGGTIFLGRGTAKSHMLDFWGLEQGHEYEIIMINIPKLYLNRIINEICHAMKLDEPGKGIMFTVPTFGSAGLNILKHILEEKGIHLPVHKPVSEEERKSMSDREFSLIISITNRDYADDAMDAAREAGAEGGIIINGRGAGIAAAEKFLGITIEHEREILFNLVEKSKVSAILKAIVEKAGIKTEARGISFVLPVNEATGVVRLDDID